MKKAIFLSFFVIAAITAFGQDKLPAITLTKLDGKKVVITEEVKKNKITVINFWATWCSPCRKELENILELYPEWKEEYGVELIAVSIDDARTKNKVKPYIDGQALPYYVLMDENKEFFHALNGITPPLTIIVDSAGNILDIKTGYIEGDEYILEEKLEKYSMKK